VASGGPGPGLEVRPVRECRSFTPERHTETVGDSCCRIGLGVRFGADAVVDVDGGDVEPGRDREGEQRT
jgi:hypothetical protein